MGGRSQERRSRADETRLGRSPEELLDLIEKDPERQGRLKALEEAVADLTRSRQGIEIALPSDDVIRFGVIADTHLGSTKERIDCLASYYANARARGISDILHAGDVLDGFGVYRGQEFEVHKVGWQQQRDWFGEQMPREAGVTTHFVTGNHDASYKKASGVDVGSELADRRADWSYIGEDTGVVTLYNQRGDAYRVLLLHPDGGTAYALSYKLQKIIESLTGGEKPDMLVIGHYHKLELLPNYRNVVGVQAGCFQDQTLFMRRKPTPAHVGGWFFEVDLHRPEHQVHVRPEFVTFF